MVDATVGDGLRVYINESSPIASGLCLEGNAVGLTNGDAEPPDIPIHVNGDADVGEWHHVTVTHVRASHLIATAHTSNKSDEEDRTSLSGVTSTDSETVWWVDTQSAECIHRTKSCSMLRKREGMLFSIEIKSGHPLPESIADRRRCEHCH